MYSATTILSNIKDCTCFYCYDSAVMWI